MTLECRFANCTHADEPGCAIHAAIAKGQLDPARVERWRKLRDEIHADVCAHAWNPEKRAFTQAYESVQVLPPTAEPRVTGSLPSIVALVERHPEAAAYAPGAIL